MITVRFPTGFSVQYNIAANVEGPDQDGITRLRDKKDGMLIARLSKECIVEFIQCCSTYQAAIESESIELQLSALKREIASLKRIINKAKEQYGGTLDYPPSTQRRDNGTEARSTRT